ncbi:phosphatidate cytidylyltransferase [Peptoniphilus sp. MSJ-1]|uniref:Phosphatidate cytidylyltransferase n=1 Tax=Peptoniphilus ovalis TaxID=2841503 RepID=A0ABS6FGH3_9FIRM|nr:phosphatidate cytidylyltransferase [Peptoniphilus ovalis]MBU5669079.1 phosphatidate cytidylyltransferase [Peptoniphilus ovalis]
MSDLYKRVITGVIGILLIIFIIYLGLSAIKISIFILTLEAIRELHNAFMKKNIKLYLPTLLIGALATFLFSYYEIKLIYAVILFFIMNSICLIVSINYSIEEYMYTNFSYFYTVFLLNLLGNIDDIYLIIAAFIISFSTDTFAYFIGSMFGKHKLIERVSPNKSVEGAIGGTISAIIITSIYFIMLNRYNSSYFINLYSVIIILAASISGQFGDLFASKIKRYTGIKDYSKLLPGHGGILDRFDSLIFISPFVYLLYFFI